VQGHETAMTTLREARLRALLSMRQLARQAELSATTIYLLETGQRTPQLLTVHKLSRALGVNPAEIDEFRSWVDAPTEPDTANDEVP
jgi:transcriptional regulator with XRE-family HTH domain